MHRRTVIQSGLVATGCLLTPTQRLLAFPFQQEVKPKIEDGIAWFDVQHWGVEGRGWNDTKSFFDRLPAKAEKTVRNAVWGLSRHSAGMMARFESNSPAIHVRYRLTNPKLEMYHMPATGVSGVDLYGENEKQQMRWIAVSRPTKQDVRRQLGPNLDVLPDSRCRKFQLYLPLYNGVESLEVGVKESSKFVPVKPRKEGTILFYGTSIMHGACASRPGMSISAILGRRLDRPVINLGFSGNGKMESELGELICEVAPSVIAVDCLPNMTPPLVKQRTEKLVLQIRKQLPKTPVLLVEDRSLQNSSFVRSRRELHAGNRRELRAAYNRLQAAGVSGVHYLTGEQLLGEDAEGTTDGSHPSDLGMVRYADAYEKALKKILA